MAQFAGEKLAELYGKEARYGNWSDTFNPNVDKQQLKAIGVYDPNSEYAKIFDELPDQTKDTTIDNDEFKSYKLDKPPKNTADYLETVEELRRAGFDVRLKDGLINNENPENIKHSNVGIRPTVAVASEPEPAPEPTPVATPAPPTNSINAPTGTGYLSPTQQISQANPQRVDVSGKGNVVRAIQDNSIRQTTIDKSDNSKVYEGSNMIYNSGGTPYAGQSFLANLGSTLNTNSSVPITIDRDGTVRVSNRSTDGIVNAMNQNKLFGGNVSIGDIASYNMYRDRA